MPDEVNHAWGSPVLKQTVTYCILKDPNAREGWYYTLLELFNFYEEQNGKADF